jgi:hypothetical protein
VEAWPLETRGFFGTHKFGINYRFLNYFFELWEKCHIGVPLLDKEANDCIIFGFMTALFLKAVALFHYFLQIFTNPFGFSLSNRRKASIPSWFVIFTNGRLASGY